MPPAQRGSGRFPCTWCTAWIWSLPVYMVHSVDLVASRVHGAQRGSGRFPCTWCTAWIWSLPVDMMHSGGLYEDRLTDVTRLYDLCSLCRLISKTMTAEPPPFHSVPTRPLKKRNAAACTPSPIPPAHPPIPPITLKPREKNKIKIKTTTNKLDVKRDSAIH